MAALKAALEQALQYKKQSAQKYYGGDRVYEGDVTVEDAGEYYAVTLPKIIDVNPYGFKIDYGIIAMNAVKRDAPHEWQISVALSMPIRILDMADNLLYTIEAASQSLNTQWHDRSFTNIGYHVNFEDITLKSPAGEVAVRIDTAQGQYYQADIHHDTEITKIERVLNGEDVAAISADTDEKSLSPLHAFSTIDMGLSLNGIKVVNKNAPLSFGGKLVAFETLDVDSVNVDYAIKVQDKDKSAPQFDVLSQSSISGITVTGSDVDETGVLPNGAKFNVLLKGVPGESQQDLMLFLQSISAANGDELAQLSQEQKDLLDDVKNQAIEAGSKIAMSFGLEFEDGFGASLGFNMIGNEENSYGFDGSVDLILDNYAALQAFIGKASTAIGAKGPSITSQTTLVLPILYSLATKERGAEGQERLKFTLKTEANNQLTLNGQNIQAFMPFFLGFLASQNAGSAGVAPDTIP